VRRTRAAAAALLTAAAIGVGACGDEDEPAVDNSVTPAATAPPQAVPASGDAIKISTDTKSKPSIDKPAGDPPTELYSRDILKGKGKAAATGDNVSVQYVGVSYSTGEQFDASWDRGGDPFPFRLGAQRVIAGWDEGVPGMRVGGRRLLVIPPDLAYGAEGRPGIAPNETLIFVIDLEKIG